MKKWMAYLFVAFLLLGVFPLLSTSTGAQAGDARADEIGINGISIVNATNVSIDETPDGVIATGNWNILVDFNLTENLNLWVLYNISRADSWAYTRTNHTLGNVALGDDITCNNGTFNFAAGEYWVNVTIGNESAPIGNTTYGELFEFGDVSELEVTDVGIMGFTDFVNGYYANESHEIAIDATNMGNQNLTQTTWITLNITNTTNNDTFLELFSIDWIEVGITATEFTDWVPGYSALYTINVTYSNEGLNGNASMYYDEFTETIQNVSAYDPVYAHTALVNETSGWTGTATVNVTNDGNIAETFTFHFWVVDDADIIVHDSEMTTSLLSPGAYELLTYNYVGLTAGTYTLNVTDPDGTNNTANIVVEEQNNPPLLADLTELPALPAKIYEDDILTFTVNYTDANDDEPDYIKCFIDATWNATTEMFEDDLANFSLEATNATDNDYTDAREYSGTWTAVVGTDHTYAFVTSDGTEVVKLEPAADFDVYDKQFAPTLVDQTGAVDAYVGDDVTFTVLYTDANGDVGDVSIKLGAWNDTHVNASNHTWEDGIYVAMENTTDNWTGGVNFTYTIDTLMNMTYRYYFKAVDTVLGDVEIGPVEFTIKKALPTEGAVSGMVTNKAGENVTGAKVIIYYIEEVKIMNGSNVTGYDNVTHYFNTTTTNGSYEKTLTFNTYMIYVTHADYKDATELTFTLDVDTLAVTKDFVLDLKDVVKEKFILSGTVTPANATVKVDGNAVTVTNGTYSIELEKGMRKVTATFTGYDDFSEDVNLTADKTFNIVMTETVVLEYTVLLGPFYGDDGILDLLEGVEVTIKVGDDTWTEKTDFLGFATFENMPWMVVPADAKVTAKYKGETYDIDPTSADYGHLKGADDDGSLLWLWILIIVVVIIIIIVLIVMKKKPQEAPVDLEEEEMEEGLGEDYDEDMDDLEEEEDFDEFEGEMDDDEMDGVDDLAEELEEFDEEEEFEDEDFGDYEEDMDDEFDDEDEDFDDEDFDDDEFDDDEFDDDF